MRSAMRYAAAVFMTLATVGGSDAQITVSTENLDIPEYSIKLQKIVDEQIVNHRTVVEYKGWASTADVIDPSK